MSLGLAAALGLISSVGVFASGDKEAVASAE